jgi:hypothetical protein
VLFLVSISLMNGPDNSQSARPITVSATNDLQYLDKNSDVLQNLELLDDLNESNTTANP